MAVESSVRLRVDGSGAERALNRVNRAAQVLQGTVGKVTAALAGVGVVGGFFRGMQEAEAAAAAVRTLGVDSEKLKEQLRGVSAQLKGQMSETALLAASYDVASAGFNNAASASNILKAAALGAKGGMSDLNTVANATTSVLNAYGMSSDKASKLVDGFIQTQNDGKIVVAQYAAQIGRVAPTAAAAGVSIDELNAAISAVTATGVPVESTFAGIRQVIAGVIKPTSEAATKAKELGIEFNTAAIKQKGFAGFLEEVIDKTGGSEVEISKLFGSVEALTAIMPLVNDRLKKFNTSLDNQQNTAGAAQDAYDEMSNTLGGQATAIANNVGNLARVFDKVFGPGLKDLLTEVNAQISAFTRFVQGIKPEAIQAAVSMAGFAAKIFLANKAFILLQKTATFAFAKRIIPLLVSTKGKLVATKLATAALAGTMRLLKTALPFGVLLFGLDMLIDKLTDANVAQRDLNNMIEFGTEKSLEGALAKQIESRALLENTIKTLENEDAKKGNLSGGAAGMMSGRMENPQLARLRKDLKDTEGLITRISVRLFELSADRRSAAAKDEATLKKLLADFKAATSGGDAGDERDKQLKRFNDRIIAARREMILATDITDKQRAELETLFEKQDIKRAYPQLTEEELAPLMRILETELGIKVQNIEKNRLKKEGAALLAEQEKQYKQIADTIQNGIVNGIYEAIEGSKSLAESFSGILKQLGKIFLAKGIGSFKNKDGTGGSGVLGRYANGGRPPVGRPSIVGERGPELFVPSRAGTIIPNHELGGSTSVVVNVDASGTAVQGNQGNADQFGRLIGQAVQAELIKQKRPGGLLTR